MNCYFYGTTRKDPSILGHNAVVAFTIPELNISFKAQYKGTDAETEYASLLALLEFIEQNQRLFTRQRIQIFGDSFTVVHQVNFKLVCSKELEPYRNLALGYRKKIGYSLGWVPRNQNQALA